MYSTKKRQAAQERAALDRVGNIHARLPASEGLREHRARRSMNDHLLTPRDLKCGSSKLAAEEACFLKWLREDGGHGKRTGKNWMRNDARLVAVGYVKAWKERSQDTVHYTLAQSGAKALLKYESANPQMILSWSEANV
jgi:hypothetical protein